MADILAQALQVVAEAETHEEHREELAAELAGAAAQMASDHAAEAAPTVHDSTHGHSIAPAGSAVHVKRPGERKLPWAGIGTTFAGERSAAEAARVSGADRITIATEQAGYMNSLTQEFIPTDTDRVLLAYTPDEGGTLHGHRLAHVTGRYAILQNADIARALDAAELPARWPVVQMGTTDRGGGLLVVMDMGQDDILGEAYQKYAMLKESRDGGSGLTLRTLHYRKVCLNGLFMQTDGATYITLNHNKTLDTDFTFTLEADLATSVEIRAAAAKAALEALGATPFPADEEAGLWDYVYPVPNKGRLLLHYERDGLSLNDVQRRRAVYLGEQHQRLAIHNAAMRSLVADSYTALCAEYPVHRGTALGAFQAVAEVADHARTVKAGSITSIDGWRAEEKLRAYAYLTAKAETE